MARIVNIMLLQMLQFTGSVIIKKQIAIYKYVYTGNIIHNGTQGCVKSWTGEQ